MRNLSITIALLLVGFSYCEQTDKFCRDLSEENVCLACVSKSYLDSDNKCQPVPNGKQIANCLYHREEDSQIICDFCSLGFHSGKSSCVKCKIENCGTCDSNANECAGCFNGMVLNEDETACIKATNLCSENCKSCFSGNISPITGCFECNTGYMMNFRDMDAINCIPASNLFCWIFDDKLDRCFICDDQNYISLDGHCHPISSHSPVLTKPQDRVKHTLAY